MNKKEETDSISFVLRGVPLLSYNQIRSFARSHRNADSEFSKRVKGLFYEKIKEQTPEVFQRKIIRRAVVQTEYFLNEKRKDPDNVRMNAKYMLDAFTQAEVIENDGLDNIIGFVDKFKVEKRAEGCPTFSFRGYDNRKKRYVTKQNKTETVVVTFKKIEWKKK